MTIVHPFGISVPNDAASVWRYLDFTKFMSMLESSALFFACTQQFEDPFEGYIESIGAGMVLEKVPIEQRAAVEASLPRDFNRFPLKNILLANCWHVNEVESAAMWKLHLKGGEGIAIESTYNRLSTSVDTGDSATFAGLVQYGRCANFFESGVVSMLRKRKSFAHENELRLLRFRSDLRTLTGGLSELPEIPGESVTVDLQRLIVRVHVAPSSPAWHLELVKSVLHSYDLDVPATQSDLYKGPLD